MKSIKEFINENNSTVMRQFVDTVNNARRSNEAHELINVAIQDILEILEKMQKKAKDLNVIKNIFNVRTNDKKELQKYQYFISTILTYLHDNLESTKVNIKDPWNSFLMYLNFTMTEHMKSAEMGELLASAISDDILGEDADWDDYKGIFMQALMNLNRLCKMVTGKYWK